MSNQPYFQFKPSIVGRYFPFVAPCKICGRALFLFASPGMYLRCGRCDETFDILPRFVPGSEKLEAMGNVSIVVAAALFSFLLVTPLEQAGLITTALGYAGFYLLSLGYIIRAGTRVRYLRTPEKRGH